MYVNYQGVVDITPELKLVLDGSPDAKTTDFGGSCKCDDDFRIYCHRKGRSNRLIERIVAVVEMHFETGDDKLKELELGVFVGAGRFLVETGKPVVVEYKVSRVCRGRD